MAGIGTGACTVAPAQCTPMGMCAVVAWPWVLALGDFGQHECGVSMMGHLLECGPALTQHLLQHFCKTIIATTMRSMAKKMDPIPMPMEVAWTSMKWKPVEFSISPTSVGVSFGVCSAFDDPLLGDSHIFYTNHQLQHEQVVHCKVMEISF